MGDFPQRWREGRCQSPVSLFENQEMFSARSGHTHRHVYTGCREWLERAGWVTSPWFPSLSLNFGAPGDDFEWRANSLPSAVQVTGLWKSAHVSLPIVFFYTGWLLPSFSLLTFFFSFLTFFFIVTFSVLLLKFISLPAIRTLLVEPLT